MKDLFKFVLEVIHDWFFYKHRGFAQPDHPDQENYPLINNPADASAQTVIDEVLQPKEKKKSSR